MNFDKELKYLETILGKDKTPILEKLLVLRNNKYKGHFFLENQFNAEVNLYLKNSMKENNSFLNKIFLPHINISPSSENIIIDKKILILEEIKFYIKNRNIDQAYDSINKIENYKAFFKVSSDEMKNYNSFMTEISRIK